MVGSVSGTDTFGTEKTPQGKQLDAQGLNPTTFCAPKKMLAEAEKLRINDEA